MDDDLDPADADALDDRSTAREAAKVARSQALGRDGVIASKHHHQWISWRENLQELIDFLMKYGIFL